MSRVIECEYCNAEVTYERSRYNKEIEGRVCEECHEELKEKS